MGEDNSSIEKGNSQEILQKGEQTILIFGQGPVIDAETRIKASDLGQPSDRVDVGFWSDNLAMAAAEINKIDPTAGQFIVMGGRTGGENFASEAEVIGQKMEQYGVPESKIRLENDSNDTIENIVNFLNLYDDSNTEREYSTLATSFHSLRVGVLMRLFDVRLKTKFQSEEVLRYGARTDPKTDLPTLDSDKWNEKALLELEEEQDINDPTRFTKYKKGTEKRDYYNRVMKDQIFIRELIEYPEKWLELVGKIKSDERVLGILTQTETLYPGLLASKYGIIQGEDMASVREKLVSIKHTGLSDETIAQWENDALNDVWPQEVRERINILVAKPE